MKIKFSRQMARIKIYILIFKVNDFSTGRAMLSSFDSTFPFKILNLFGKTRS